MTWQEYQEAAAMLYEQLEGVGTVSRNQMIPDRITGQLRQVDALLDVETKGHHIRILIDAKFYSIPIDVKVVEEVAALAQAIGANKSIIVAPNGWTEPAKKKAEYLFCDLSLMSLEEALDIIVVDKWMMCPRCYRDCIVMDQDNAVQTTSGGWIWWIAGACRECHHMIVWCQDCGEEFQLEAGQHMKCSCNYEWTNQEGVLEFAIGEENEDA